MKLGLIARHDNSGLGSLSLEFARHLKPTKVLLVSNGVYQTFPERYADFDTRRIPAREEMTRADIDWLFDGTDVILSFETFYDLGFVWKAHRASKKTALVTMCEMQHEKVQANHMPDLLICPSSLDMELYEQHFPSVPKVSIAPPIATDRLVWKQRRTATHFVHTSSHGGLRGRKGTSIIIEAMKQVKADIKLTIYSWKPIVCADPRVEVKVQNFRNYWQCWQEGDVLVYPQGANGISLPCQEAFASGLAVVTTDQRPFNEWLPKRPLFAPIGWTKARMGKDLIVVDEPIIDPTVLAAKIDEIAGIDITAESEAGRRWAEANSWDALLPKYLEALNSL